MYACGIAKSKKELEKHKQITNMKCMEKCKSRRTRKKQNIAPSIGRTIIQLHAIVYAVIYYDFRAAFMEIKCLKWTREPFFFFDFFLDEREISCMKRTNERPLTEIERERHITHLTKVK